MAINFQCDLHCIIFSILFNSWETRQIRAFLKTMRVKVILLKIDDYLFYFFDFVKQIVHCQCFVGYMKCFENS